MELKGGLKVIVFDVEGVLQIAKNKSYQKRLHTNLGVHENVLKKLKISLDTYFDLLDTDYSLSMEGKIKKSKLLSRLSEKFKYPKNKIEKLYSSAYTNKYLENTFLLDLVKNLKKKGFKVAVLSDQWHLSSPSLIPKKFYRIFNPVVVSCDVGTRKPNLDIYKILLKKLKVLPKEVLFIDDRPWNLPPAEKLGIKTIHFKGNSNIKKRLKEFGIVI
ncbi:MAG: HAD-IA family hydrolase [Nanoarchaeota archaeon]|nr:HAD-IA family hydrolase [Nanoarchaeota archaeon]